MLVKFIVFLMVLGLAVKVGFWLVMATGGLFAFQFATNMDGGRAAQIFAFVIVFGIVGYVAMYFLVAAAFVLAVRVAAEV